MVQIKYNSEHGVENPLLVRVANSSQQEREFVTNMVAGMLSVVCCSVLQCGVAL